MTEIDQNDRRIAGTGAGAINLSTAAPVLDRPVSDDDRLLTDDGEDMGAMLADLEIEPGEVPTEAEAVQYLEELEREGEALTEAEVIEILKSLKREGEVLTATDDDDDEFAVAAPPRRDKKDANAEIATLALVYQREAEKERKAAGRKRRRQLRRDREQAASPETAIKRKAAGRLKALRLATKAPGDDKLLQQLFGREESITKWWLAERIAELRHGGRASLRQIAAVRSELARYPYDHNKAKRALHTIRQLEEAGRPWSR